MTDSVDSLHPDEIESRVWEYVPRFEGRPTLCRFTDYEALFARWEEAERKADARAEVGYAVEANALREQIRQQREEFDRIVARERDAREKAEAERDGWRDQVAQAVELEQAAEELAEAVEDGIASGRMRAALARFRDTQKQEGNDE